MTEPVVTYYMSRVVDLPPLVAQAAFDCQLLRDDLASGVGVAVIGSRLELSGRSRQSNGRFGTPYRVMSGTLYAGLRRLHVDLELSSWSARRVQLGLYPRLSCNRRHPSDPLLTAGHEVLARLDRVLCCWAEAPLFEISGSSNGRVVPLALRGATRRRHSPPTFTWRRPDVG